jgi:hypothetical protein
MQRAVHVSDLSDNPQYGECLYCAKCASEYSADRSDYFMADPQTIFRCCRRLMRLVVKRTVYEERTA